VLPIFYLSCLSYYLTFLPFSSPFTCTLSIPPFLYPFSYTSSIPPFSYPFSFTLSIQPFLYPFSYTSSIPPFLYPFSFTVLITFYFYWCKPIYLFIFIRCSLTVLFAFSPLAVALPFFGPCVHWLIGFLVNWVMVHWVICRLGNGALGNL
jgi:hypothetical protein